MLDPFDLPGPSPDPAQPSATHAGGAADDAVARRRSPPPGSSGELAGGHRAHSPVATALRSADEAVVTDLDARPEVATASAGRFNRLDLPIGPLAARTARRYLVSSLTDLTPDVMDDVLLLTSELVTNAVQHGSAPIRLQLHRRGVTLRVEISDGGALFAMAPIPARSRTAEGGRGLLLVHALASDWGSRAQEDASPGKTVWFELSFDPAAESF